MRPKINYDKLITLRSFLGDPINQFVNLANSLSTHPAKKLKKNKFNSIPTASAQKKKKKKKKYLERKSKIEIEDISDGNL